LFGEGASFHLLYLWAVIALNSVERNSTHQYMIIKYSVAHKQHAAVHIFDRQFLGVERQI